MTTAISLLFQLLPALSLAPQSPPITPALEQVSDSSQRIVPAPLVRRDGIDWAALRAHAEPEPQDTVRKRRQKAIEHSNGYYTRLKLHRVLSFAMLPLFAGSFITGDQVLRKGDDAPGWAKSLHSPFAAGTAVVFGVNTFTGVWNLWESRKDPNARAKRYVHSLLFIASGAGFVYAASKVPDKHTTGTRNFDAHRNIALASMGISVSSWALMMFFK